MEAHEARTKADAVLAAWAQRHHLSDEQRRTVRAHVEQTASGYDVSLSKDKHAGASITPEALNELEGEIRHALRIAG